MPWYRLLAGLRHHDLLPPCLASVVTPKPANGGQGKTGQREGRGLSSFILPPPVAASLISYANSEDHI
jgi:hypothetical protein